MWFIVFAISIASAASSVENEVDLSRQGLEKEFFRSINETMIHQIDNTTVLNLQGNKLDSFLDCSARLTKLEALDLSQNRLNRFFLVCMEEENLRKLNVSHNQIYYINETHTLTHRVSKLEVLDMSFNLINHIGSQTLRHMENLRYLKLNANPIGNNFAETAFRSLSSLVYLDLSDISATRFPARLFIPLADLMHISLAYNPIVTVPALPEGLESLDISGTFIIKLDGIDHPNLITLLMRSMPLMEILDFNQLANLRKLTILSADNSPKLKALTFDPRRGDIPCRLREVLLKNCSIGRIDAELLPVMQHTSIIDLQENPWQCDCGLKWILTLNSTEHYRDDVRCESPIEFRGKRVFELSAGDFGCNRLLHLALWLLFGLLVSAVIVGAFVYLVRRPLKKWCAGARYGNTIIYKNMSATAHEGEKILDQCDITDYP